MISAERIGHPNLPTWTEQDFIDWQEGIITTAKHVLDREHELRPLVFMLTLPDHIDNSVRPNLVPLDALRAGRQRSTPEDWQKADGLYVTAVLPISHHVDDLWEYARACLIKPETRDKMDVSDAVAASFGMTRQEARAKALAILLKHAGGMNEKDLIGIYIRDCLRRVRAMAYVKLDDAFVWVHPVGLAPGTPGALKEAERIAPPDLSADPSSVECILTSLETQTFMRVVALPYERAVRKTGAVLRYLEPRVSHARRSATKEEELSGRYMWMLPEPQ